MDAPGAVALPNNVAISQGWVSIAWFGAVGDDPILDDAAHQAAYAYVAAAGGGTVFYPRLSGGKKYRFTTTLVLTTGYVSFIGERGGSILRYSGTGPLFHCPTTTAIDQNTFRHLYVEIETTGSHFLQVGDPTDGSLLHFRNDWKLEDIYANGLDATVTGRYGIVLSQLGASEINNVTLVNFESCWVLSDTTANKIGRVRAQACKNGFAWINPAGVGGASDVVTNLDCLAPAYGNGGVGLLISVSDLHIIHGFFEPTVIGATPSNAVVVKVTGDPNYGSLSVIDRAFFSNTNQTWINAVVEIDSLVTDFRIKECYGDLNTNVPKPVTIGDPQYINKGANHVFRNANPDFMSWLRKNQGSKYYVDGWDADLGDNGTSWYVQAPTWANRSFCRILELISGALPIQSVTYGTPTVIEVDGNDFPASGGSVHVLGVTGITGGVGYDGNWYPCTVSGNNVTLTGSSGSGSYTSGGTAAIYNPPIPAAAKSLEQWYNAILDQVFEVCMDRGTGVFKDRVMQLHDLELWIDGITTYLFLAGSFQSRNGATFGTTGQAWLAFLSAIKDSGGNAAITFNAPGLIQLPAYGAGVLSTDASGNVTAGSAGSGTVTHTTSALTAGQLVIGNGGADIKPGDLTGAVTTSGGTATTLTVQPALAYSSADLTLTTSYQDITGATITLGAAGTYLIIGVFDLLLGGAGDVGQTLSGQLVANGSAQSQIVNMTSLTAGERNMNTQQWLYTSAGASEVVKLQAKKNGGTGSSQALHPGTSISALGPF